MRLAVIRPVALQLLRSAARVSAPALDRRDTLHQRQQLRDVVAVRARQTQRERGAVALHQQMMFAAQFASIYRTFAGFFCPRDRLSRWSCQPPLAPTRVAPRPGTRRGCFATAGARRPSHAIQEVCGGRCAPKGSRSWGGSDSHGTPVFKTKIMPVITWRASAGFRPAYCRWRLCLSFGNRGSMRRHS